VQYLAAEGAKLDAIYYCPHHPTEGFPPYVAQCDCRKPLPGMLLQAARAFGLDLERSFVIGDKVSDIQVGHAVGATSMLVLTGYGKTSLEKSRSVHVLPRHVVPSLREAVQLILTAVGRHAEHTH
jgi:D-glycero-D-manno-heptose 1,7-bisphosphate phosphatase